MTGKGTKVETPLHQFLHTPLLIINPRNYGLFTETPVVSHKVGATMHAACIRS